MTLAQFSSVRASRLFTSGITIALVLGATRAESRPDEGASGPRGTGEVPAADIAVRGYLVHFRNEQAGGIALGAQGTVRVGWIEFGGVAEAGSTLLDYSYSSLAGAAGLGWRHDSGPRVGAFATGGVRRYEGFDKRVPRRRSRRKRVRAFCWGSTPRESSLRHRL